MMASFTPSTSFRLLDACSRLYDKVCWSVGRSVCRSVGPHFTPIYVGRFGLPLVGAK